MPSDKGDFLSVALQMGHALGVARFVTFLLVRSSATTLRRSTSCRISEATESQSHRVVNETQCISVVKRQPGCSA